MRQAEADRLADTLGEALPEFEVSAAPWSDERGEWIVTVWAEESVLVDVFWTGSAVRSEYLLRKVSLGDEVGRAEDVAGIAALVRAHVAGVSA